MLVAQAIDQGRPPLTGQAIVHVHVTDVNDESPYFLPPTPEGSVIEGAEADTPVLRLSSMTYDDDIPPNQVFTFIQFGLYHMKPVFSE